MHMAITSNRERPKGPLAGWLGSFGRNLSALSAAAQAFRYLFRSFSTLCIGWLAINIVVHDLNAMPALSDVASLPPSDRRDGVD